MNERAGRSDEVEAILDRVERRVVAQVARDNDLLGPLDEDEVKARVKAMPSGIRGPMVFALAGLPSLRRAWAEQDRTAVGEAYARMILRSIACFLGSEDFSELVGIGRVFGESEAMLACVLEVAER
ncbi:MAG: hypothetical protein CMJ52_02465 [Planctomycetaceae bacterium]|nr:hypothetical protein [Planctomycetaceae bacterium]